MDRNENDLLTIREVSEICRMDYQTIWRWVKAGKLKAFRVGWNYRVRVADLNEFISVGENTKR
jgi:excisionase family DNA binding protein